jgi:S-adenosylmethionine-diacylglycerol 3-amino-3-carboxypropyl transferase
MRPSLRAPIQERTSFADIRYANCWEDAEVLACALAPLDGARCLSIASAGDNTLSLLARGARSVVAVDLSAAQLALLELKMAAFRSLGYEDLLGFLGVRASRGRRAIHRDLRRHLGQEARAFWDARGREVEAGVIHCGRLEAYFRAFRRMALPLVHGRRTVAALLAPKAAEERRRFYEESWDTWRWRGLVRAFFSRPVMGHLGRDPEFFRHAEDPVAASILERTRRALTELPTDGNPYLEYILTGSFGAALPDYLRPDRYEAIRGGIGRVRLRRAAVEEAVQGLAPASIDAFNLSDVAEYMDVARYHRLLLGLRRVAAPGARLAYWNLLVERRRPEFLRDLLEAQVDLGQALHDRAQAFFYRAFVLEVAR